MLLRKSEIKKGELGKGEVKHVEAVTFESVYEIPKYSVEYWYLLAESRDSLPHAHHYQQKKKKIKW